MHEEFKDITLAERNFRIRKFDALTGCYIAYQVMTQVLPAGMDKQVSGIMPNGELPAGRSLMPESEFKSLMKKCLGICYEVLPGAEAPVMRGNGGWGVQNIETDMGLVLALVINAIIFNVQGFFAGSALKDLKASLAGMSLFNAQTSTNSPTPQQ